MKESIEKWTCDICDTVRHVNINDSNCTEEARSIVTSHGSEEKPNMFNDVCRTCFNEVIKTIKERVK